MTTHDIIRGVEVFWLLLLLLFGKKSQDGFTAPHLFFFYTPLAFTACRNRAEI